MVTWAVETDYIVKEDILQAKERAHLGLENI